MPPNAIHSKYSRLKTQNSKLLILGILLLLALFGMSFPNLYAGHVAHVLRFVIGLRKCHGTASGMLRCSTWWMAAPSTFFDRRSLSALSVVLDEDNGKEVEKAKPYKCGYCKTGTEDRYWERVVDRIYHPRCIPILWSLLDAFCERGFLGWRL